MNTIGRPRQRRRLILTCVECRKRKQKCDRGHPCAQCVVRGTENACTYERYKSPGAAAAHGSSLSDQSSPKDHASPPKDPNASTLLSHAHDYGYSNSNSLNSMGMLSKVITGIDADLSSSNPAVASQMQIESRVRAEYYNYVRRLPPRSHCEVLFQYFFGGGNQINNAIDETFFQEQSERWWGSAYEILLKSGPEKLPEDLLWFPALIFQVLAVALQFMPLSYDPRLDDIKFAPSQDWTELSREYTDCGVALAKLLTRARMTLVGVQQSFMRDFWLTNVGDLMQAWNHSGQTVRDALALGLDAEPPIPSTTQPEALLDALWMNELRKRTWLNLVVWDSYMAIALGRPMFIDIKKSTVSPPIDCNIPTDRLKRVPVARSDQDKPTPMTERLLRYKLSVRFCEIRKLEAEGPIPKSPEKVRELHHFAVDIRKNLPAFYRESNPYTRWDAELAFVPTHRELISFLIDSFLMALHRPYVFTREKSQRQVYESALAILDSQDRLFENNREAATHFNIGLTFPTFDAAVLLAVVLVSNPERYHESFSRAYQSLKNALERLTFIGSSMQLAKTGAEILATTISRVVEAQQRIGFPVSLRNISTDENVVPAQDPSGFSQAPTLEARTPDHRGTSTDPSTTGISPESDSWRFEPNPTIMDWTMDNPEFADFDFSNLEVPMPLKELFLDEEVATLPGGADDPSTNWMYAPPLVQQQQDRLGLENMQGGEEAQMQSLGGDSDGGENLLWNFLAGY